MPSREPPASPGGAVPHLAGWSRTAAAPRARRADGDDDDPMGWPLGTRDHLDVALLRLHRLALAAAVRAGSGSSPPVTPTQIRVLTLLAASQEAMPLSAIADALFVSPPSASRLCQRLVRDGLVTRSAGPGHYILMSLSREGARVLAAVNQARILPFRQLIDVLPPPRRAAVVAALTELGRQESQQHLAW